MLAIHNYNIVKSLTFIKWFKMSSSFTNLVSYCNLTLGIIGYSKATSFLIPYLSYWLPSNHLSQANPVVYSRTECHTKQVYYQRTGQFFITSVCWWKHRNGSGRISTSCHEYILECTELSSIACLSKKQFERLFNSLVGVNPKEYTRIVRFQKALELMQHQSGEINQEQIAYASGYADQSHFIREFKKFSGYTPTSLLKVSNPYSDLFTNPV